MMTIAIRTIITVITCTINRAVSGFGNILRNSPTPFLVQKLGNFNFWGSILVQKLGIVHGNKGDQWITVKPLEMPLELF